jgi:hypothetical protein
MMTRMKVSALLFANWSMSSGVILLFSIWEGGRMRGTAVTCVYNDNKKKSATKIAAVKMENRFIMD